MIAIPRYQHVSSGGLALLVHGLFFLALVLGVSWKTLPQLPVEADLWSALPEPLPLPEPEPLEPPAPPPPEPVAAAKPEAADIALEQEKKRRAEAARQAERARQEALERQAEEAARLEQERLDKERVDKERVERERLAQEEKERQERIKREQARRQMEQEMARQAQEELAAEAAQLRAAQAQAARRASTIDDFKRRIQVKIQSYVRLPQKLAGNPEAEFRVSLLPNGEVLRATLVRSSGQTAYDVEVERAILKASPLPLPNEKEIAASFRDDLTLKFRPFEEARRVY